MTSLKSRRSISKTEMKRLFYKKVSAIDLLENGSYSYLFKRPHTIVIKCEICLNSNKPIRR